jgi:hypothetical protein
MFQKNLAPKFEKKILDVFLTKMSSDRHKVDRWEINRIWIVLRNGL